MKNIQQILIKISSEIYYTLYQIITYLKKQFIMLNCWQKDRDVGSELRQLLFYREMPITKVPVVQSRGLFHSNRSDSNFSWTVWAESADSAAYTKH